MKTLIRLHQVLLVLAILSGCYSPDLRDCTVTCGGSDECAGGQICTKGLCAAQGVSCGPGGMATDAGVVMIHVMIGGTGKVTLGTSACGDNGVRDCMIAVERGSVTAVAAPLQTDHPFDKWESPTCNNQPASCTFTANGPTTIEAKFK